MWVRATRLARHVRRRSRPRVHRLDGADASTQPDRAEQPWIDDVRSASDVRRPAATSHETRIVDLAAQVNLPYDELVRLLIAQGERELKRRRVAWLRRHFPYVLAILAV